jgi:hypothetical protein
VVAQKLKRLREEDEAANRALTKLLTFPRQAPVIIDSERWTGFLQRAREIQEIRSIMQQVQDNWEAERDNLIAMLVDGAEIERDGH